MGTYNGWTNRETWRANLELVDGLDPSDWWDADADSVEELTDKLAETLNEITAETLLDARPGRFSPFVEGLVLDFLDRVDWHEIAAHLVEDYADQLPERFRATEEPSEEVSK